jgi:hypothetical protein
VTDGPLTRRYLWILLGVVALVLIAAWSGAARPARSLEARGFAGGSDWYHALEVVAELRERPPGLPLVVLIGGSCARECTVSDADWAAQVRRRAGPEVDTYDLGSRNQTFYEDVALVKALPKTPAIVFIAVNTERFTSPYTTRPVSLEPDPVKSAWYAQHHYTSARILSLQRKREMARDWMVRRYPVFRSRYAYNLGQLGRVPRECQKRPYLHPVILEMPRNMQVIGSALSRPIRQYHGGCKDLAKEYRIPFVNFVAAARLVNRDFYDLGHLVQPGRVKFQRLLSDRTIALLARYGMTPSPSPSPSESASPSPSPSESSPSPSPSGAR